MEATITNGKKSINVSLPEDMFEDLENTRIIIGTEQYKLVSTKSKEDKEREKAAIEFGEVVYDKLYKSYPDFGMETCKTTRKDMTTIIKAEIENNKDKYPALANDKNMDQLLAGLVTAYGNYCVVRKRMEEEEKLIKETQLDENVFFDYIKRFKKAFEESTCIKDVHESIVKLHQYAGIDKRDLYGYTYIFNCLSPFYDKIKEIETELNEMKPVVSIKDHALFTDTKYWKEAAQKQMVSSVIENLNKLEAKYRSWEEDRFKDPKDAYKYYAKELIKQYNHVIEGRDNIVNYTNTLHKEDGSKLDELTEEQTGTLDKLINESNKRYRDMLAVLADLRIKYQLNAKDMVNNDAIIINANFGLIEFWNQNISNAPHNEKFMTLNKMVMQLQTHSKVLEKTITGDIKTADLVSGKYSTEDLVKLTAQPSK